MATTISGTVLLDLAFQEVVSSGMKAGPVTTRLMESLNLTNGTANGSINAAYAATATGIGAGVTTVYDLIGVLPATDGTTQNFDEVVLVAVKNKSSTAANYLTVGPDATNGFGVVSASVGFWAAAIGSGGGSIVPADGSSWTVMYCHGGVPAAAGSTDELAVLTQGGTSSNTWDILILGRDNP